MSLLIKAAAVALAGAVMAMMLKKNAPELALALSIAVTLAAAGLAAQLISQLREVTDLAREQTGLSPAVVTPVLKCVGIGVVTRLAADLCRDAGQSAAASAVELAGAACALAASLPLIRSLLLLAGQLS